MINPNLYIKDSKGRGRGVFTKKNIPANTIIEIAPVVVLSVKESRVALHTKLRNYFFRWGDKARNMAVALGYASVYNHAYTSNAEYKADFKKNTLTIKTVKKIPKDSEIFVNYNCKSTDKTPIWFDAI